MSDQQESRGQFVPALVLESTATVQQRARNYAFYLRIRDGVPGHDRECGLKTFWFDVPGLPMFRLDPESDCYRRLVSYIVDHTDAKCDADEEVARLLLENHRLTELVAAADVVIADLKAGLKEALDEWDAWWVDRHVPGENEPQAHQRSIELRKLVEP